MEHIHIHTKQLHSEIVFDMMRGRLLRSFCLSCGQKIYEVTSKDMMEPIFNFNSTLNESKEKEN